MPISVAELRIAVRLSNGLMHADCHIAMTRRVAELLRPRPDAVPWTTMCEGCREWVDGIYRVLLDGKRICITCAARAGDQDAQKSLARQGRWDPATHKPVEPRPAPPPPPPPAAPPSRAAYVGTFNTLDDL